MFRRETFPPSWPDLRSFHLRAIDEGKFYEERVAADLSNLFLDTVYPLLARATADGTPNADLEDVRQAALVLLNRLSAYARRHTSYNEICQHRFPPCWREQWRGRAFPGPWLKSGHSSPGNGMPEMWAGTFDEEYAKANAVII